MSSNNIKCNTTLNAKNSVVSFVAACSFSFAWMRAITSGLLQFGWRSLRGRLLGLLGRCESAVRDAAFHFPVRATLAAVAVSWEAAVLSLLSKMTAACRQGEGDDVSVKTGIRKECSQV
jgi:hypothetical protein